MAVSGTKRKRVSKKSKVSWRKHAKVADIERFLDEQREEQVLGAQIETISNDQLFVLDAKPGDTEILSREKRKLRATRPLRGFSALQAYTKVPDPIKKRNRVRTNEERKSSLVKKKEIENRQKGILKSKEINAIAERRQYEIKKDRTEKRGDFLKDVWSNEKTLSIQNDPWLEPIAKVHNLRNTGVAVKKYVKDLRAKRSLLPAVEVPHPGMSYNPSLKDHQDLLKTVAEQEIKIIKNEEHLNRVTRDMFRKVPEDKKQTEWMVEMSQGIPSKTNEENDKLKVKDEAENSDLDRISINPPVQNKKKTLKQRRKQREQLELEKQRKAKKLDKKKIGDIHTLKVLQKKLELTEKKHEKLRDIRKIRTEQKKLKPKVLSATKFEDLGPDFQMGQDISGNLRALKKEGNLLTDRFKSLQKRNILEPSKRARKKKPKVKKYTKPGHKDDWEKTVARSSSNSYSRIK